MPVQSSGRISRLLTGWESLPGPLGQRLAAALADLVEQGDVRGGDRLPSERALASALCVSRGTVTDAYNRLRGDGWIESRTGSGSYVATGRALDEAGALAEARLSSFEGRAARRCHDLSSGAPGGLDLVSEHSARVLGSDRLFRLMSGDGYEPAGLAELRDALATYYADLGVPTREEELLVTSGSQQALNLIAGTFVNPGDVVLVEDPSYRGALDVFRAHGARLVPVPVDIEGPDVEVLGRLVRRLRPRAVYLLPVAHNPTGYVISERRAAAVSDVLAGTETLLVEDGSPADLLLRDERPPPPLGRDLPAEQWVAIGSASKLFWGGLRVGWIRSGAPALATLGRAKAVADLSTSLLGQLLTASCLAEVDEARRRRRHQLSAGYDLAAQVLGATAPEWSWRRPAGGSGLWVRLPGTDTVAFGQHARRHGVLVVPGPVFSPVDGFRDYLRIPFWKDPAELEVDLRQLTELWQAALYPIRSDRPMNRTAVNPRRRGSQKTR
jgi:DNA-binding transcriptional MocR family regulator